MPENQQHLEGQLHQQISEMSKRERDCWEADDQHDMLDIKQT